MGQLLYALQFRGQAAPVEGTAGVLRATASSPSNVITTTLGEGGLSGVVAPAAGGRATLESTVTMTGEASFTEDGVIVFGAGDRLVFSTIGQGHIAPSAGPRLAAGAVSWRIESGEGRFAGASGYITSNFTVNDVGELVDNQVGVIFVPS